MPINDASLPPMPAPPTSPVRGVVIVAALGLALVAVGFAGVDRWFYERVALRINTGDALSGDFYQSTKFVWNILRLPGLIYGFLAGYFIVLLGRTEPWRPANMLMLTVGLTALLGNLLQGAIGRVRPNMAESHLAFHAPFSGLLAGNPDGFPSGEVTTAFALSYALARTFPGGGAWWYLLGVSAAVARVVPGMHYLSDAGAGAVVGVLATHALYETVARWMKKREFRVKS